MTDSPFDQSASRSLWVRVIPIAALLILTVGFAWFFTRDADAPSAAPAHQHGAASSEGATTMFTVDSAAARRIGVTFATVERAPLVRSLRVAARVVVDETRRSTIAPKVEGWVEELFVNTTGVTVEAGAPLFALYSPMLVAAQEELVLAVRLAAAEQARGDSTGTAADLLRSARRRLEYSDVPPSVIERIIATRATTRTLEFRAPRTGVVIAKDVVVGQQVMAGAPAFTIAALDRVWVEGEVFEQDLRDARLGSVAQVELEAEPGVPRLGRVTFISPVVREDTRTATIRVELPNAGARIKPGMLGTLLLDTREGVRVLQVPRSAVLLTGARAIVFVRMPDGMLEPREVTLGAATDDRQEVLSGLSEGEVVVRSATFLVDAESNLRAAVGGMAGMPGMDAAPPKVPDTTHEH